MMTGYWKEGGATARALDRTGWLSTGDVAEIADGRIFIRGRLREMMVLSVGEKVNPNVVEADLSHDRLFKQVAVIGERRPFLVAVIVLDADAWRRFAAEKGLDPERPNHPASKIEVLARIAPLLAALPRYSQVRAVHLTLEPWTIQAGCSHQPSRKARRCTATVRKRDRHLVCQSPPEPFDLDHKHRCASAYALFYRFFSAAHGRDARSENCMSYGRRRLIVRTQHAQAHSNPY